MNRKQLGILLVAMTGLAAACSGKNYDDDDDDGGESGEAGGGGSSATGGSGGSSSGGSSSGGSSSGGSSSGGTSGTAGSGGGSFLSDCNDICDRASICPDANPTSCSNGCTQLNAIVSANVCKAEIEALYDCGGTTADICDDTACDSEGSTAANCLVVYCASNPTVTFCEAA